MKLKLFFSTLLVTTILCIASCSKNGAPSIAGFWEGSFGNGVNNTGSYNAFLFKNNTTVRGYFNGTDTTDADIADGTYTISDGVAKLSFEGESFIYLGTVNNNTINGTWGFNPKVPGIEGRFIVAKK